MVLILIALFMIIIFINLYLQNDILKYLTFFIFITVIFIAINNNKNIIYGSNENKVVYDDIREYSNDFNENHKFYLSYLLITMVYFYATAGTIIDDSFIRSNFTYAPVFKFLEMALVFCFFYIPEIFCRYVHKTNSKNHRDNYKDNKSYTPCVNEYIDTALAHIDNNYSILKKYNIDIKEIFNKNFIEVDENYPDKDNPLSINEHIEYYRRNKNAINKYLKFNNDNNFPIFTSPLLIIINSKDDNSLNILKEFLDLNPSLIKRYIRSKNIYLDTPLIAAVKNNRIDMIKELVVNRNILLDPWALDPETHNNAIMYAIISETNDDIKEELITLLYPKYKNVPLLPIHNIKGETIEDLLDKNINKLKNYESIKKKILEQDIAAQAFFYNFKNFAYKYFYKAPTELLNNMNKLSNSFYNFLENSVYKFVEGLNYFRKIIGLKEEFIQN